jgi:hypothetical protein
MNDRAGPPVPTLDEWFLLDAFLGRTAPVTSSVSPGRTGWRVPDAVGWHAYRFGNAQGRPAARRPPVAAPRGFERPFGLAREHCSVTHTEDNWGISFARWGNPPTGLLSQVPLFVRQLVSELTWGLCLPRVSLCLHSPWFVAKSYDAERFKAPCGVRNRHFSSLAPDGRQRTEPVPSAPDHGQGNAAPLLQAIKLNTQLSRQSCSGGASGLPASWRRRLRLRRAPTSEPDPTLMARDHHERAGKIGYFVQQLSA